jgi:hypothetical protein
VEDTLEFRSVSSIILHVRKSQEKRRGKKKGKRKRKIICSNYVFVEIMFGELYTFDLCRILWKKKKKKKKKLLA